MSLEIAIPSHIEKHLETEWGSELPRRAAEAVAIEGYRSGALSLGEVAEMLSLSIDEADGFLKECDILLIEDIDQIDIENRMLEDLSPVKTGYSIRLCL